MELLLSVGWKRQRSAANLILGAVERVFLVLLQCRWYKRTREVQAVLCKKRVCCMLYLQILKSCHFLGKNSVFKVPKHIRPRSGITVATE